MSPVARAVTAALFAFVWQGAVVGVALSVTLALLARRSANVRYLACCTAMVVLVLLPAATAWLAFAGADAAVPLLRMAPDLGSSRFAALQVWAIPVWSL